MAGAVSRTSYAEVAERFEAIVGTGDAAVLGADLLEILHLLDREHGLRRALSDPSRSGADKAQVVTVLLEGKVGAPALELFQEVVRRKWSRPTELTDAVEQLAVTAQAAAAESAGQLGELEDELFRFSRLIDAEPRLRNALAGQQLPAERKGALLDDLIGAKVAPTTLALVREIVTNPRGRSLERGLAEYGKFVAARRNRLVAVVRTAVALTGEQQSRLAAALGASYGRDVHLNIEIDPTVIGGIAVQLGDEAIDGTIAGRLDGVRRRIAS